MRNFRSLILADRLSKGIDIARVSRKLALLRAHGLIKNIPHTHRNEFINIGRTTITALLAARNATPKDLSAA